MANTVFLKKMSAGNREREFLFQQTFFGNQLMYDIDVTDDNNNRISFKMRRDEDVGQWKILAQVLPIWIFDCEAALNNAIEENLRERY